MATNYGGQLSSRDWKKSQQVHKITELQRAVPCSERADDCHRTEGRGKMQGEGVYAHKRHRRTGETPGPSVSAEITLGAALSNGSLELDIPDLNCKVARFHFNPGV